MSRQTSCLCNVCVYRRRDSLACTSAGPYIAHEPADKLLMYIAYQPARILHISRPVYCTSAGPYTAYQPARILHINRPAYCISAGPYIAYQPVRILHISRPVFCISEAEQGGDFEGLLSHIFYHAQAEPGDASPARPAVVRWEDCEVKPCDKGWGR